MASVDEARVSLPLRDDHSRQPGLPTLIEPAISPTVPGVGFGRRPFRFVTLPCWDFLLGLSGFEVQCRPRTYGARKFSPGRRHSGQPSARFLISTVDARRTYSRVRRLQKLQKLTWDYHLHPRSGRNAVQRRLQEARPEASQPGFSLIAAAMTSRFLRGCRAT